MRILSVLLIGLAAASSVKAAKPPSADVQDFVLLTSTRPVFVRLHLTIDGKPYRQVWDQFFEHLFRNLDANKDGLLDAEEQKNVPAPQSLFPMHNYFVWELDRVNVNVNGSTMRHFSTKPKVVPPLKLAGLKKRFESAGALPFRLDGGSLDGVKIIWDVSESRAPVNAASLNAALFTMLDRNQDGRLSKIELEAAEKRFLANDFDDDEIVTTSEALGRDDSARQAAIGQFNISSLSSSTDDSTTRLVHPLSADAKSRQALVARLFRTYGPKVTKELTPGLTRKQIGLDTPHFNKLDRNDDNALNYKELEGLVTGKPDVEFRINVGNKQAVTVLRGDVPRASAIVPGEIVSLGAMQLHVRLPLNKPNRRDENSNSPSGVHPRTFKMIDRDNNGYLDESEAARSPVYGGVFKLLDADNDGKVYLKEVEAYHRRLQELLDRAGASWTSLRVTDDGRGLFGLIDTNHDDRLSVREIRNSAQLVKQLDRDDDGAIALAEVPRRYELFMSQGGTGQHAEYAVANAAKRALATGMPTWFQKMDRNRDGDVSYREFIGDRFTFKKIDGDGDRLLSADEATKADAELRKHK